MKIYHNPRCSKSRETLSLLREKGAEPEIIEYMTTPMHKEEIQGICNLLKITPSEIVRTNETIWKNDYKDKDMSNSDIIEAIIKHPNLLQRPIVIEGDRAVIGRPPENVLQLL